MLYISTTKLWFSLKVIQYSPFIEKASGKTIGDTNKLIWTSITNPKYNNSKSQRGMASTNSLKLVGEIGTWDTLGSSHGKRFVVLMP